MPLVVASLKDTGKENVTEEVLSKIKKTLILEPKEIVLADARIAPQWITNIVLQLLKD
jgi:hypothetical protein